MRAMLQLQTSKDQKGVALSNFLDEQTIVVDVNVI
jgi:hypothetical protein